MGKTEEGKKRLAAAKLKETPKSKLKVGEPGQASLPQAPDPVAKRATAQETTSQGGARFEENKDRRVQETPVGSWSL